MHDRVAVAFLSILGAGGALAVADERSRSADEVRAIVSEMLADAGGRASLLQGGSSGSGWDDGFWLRPGDGAFRLRVHGQFQFQFAGSSRDGAMNDYDHDFAVRRAKLFFSGRVHDEWSYLINGAVGRTDGELTLEDARVWRTLGEDGPVLTLGQFKSGFMLEERTSSTRQLGVDRSFLNEWFTVDRTQGVMLSDRGERARWWAMLSDGVRATSFGLNGEGSNIDLGTANTDFSATAGAAFLLGDGATWSQFNDLSSASDAPLAARLGVAGHYQDGSNLGAGATARVFSATADASLEFGGASAQAWGVWQSTENELGVSANDFDQWGFGVQGAVFLSPDEWELFGRWEHLDFDGALPAGRGDSLSLLTVGVTRYLHGHAVRWTTQAVYAFDTVPVSRAPLGLLADAAGEDGQLGFVTQIQILF